MRNHSSPTFIGDARHEQLSKDVQGEFVFLLGETYYKIHNYDALPPFFISLASSSDHWLFISTTGGLTAGRVSAENALFPYYTVDKVSENSETTGAKTILRVTREQRTSLWEPFSDRYSGLYQTRRHLYKNTSGTAIVFEELNHSLGLVFRYAWRSADAFGFVKSSWLQNTSAAGCTVELLDGLQNILPANVTSATQNTFSPLLDAYKRSELLPDAGLGLYYLNSTLTDLAEPSESLLASTVTQLGLPANGYLLCSQQLDAFRSGQEIQSEHEIRGQRGAYFVHAALSLAPAEERAWHLLADVNQDSAAIVALRRRLAGSLPALLQALDEDLSTNRHSLEKIVASADGLQTSNLAMHSAHHFANVMFNVMRGGIFGDQYRLTRQDFIDFVGQRNRGLLTRCATFFAGLAPEMHITQLKTLAEAHGDPDLIRMSSTYLPLSFSRRHGDPSRPWNRFAINIKKPDGSRQLDYEGNWRDIFQNWEALAYSYPEYVESMICTFLNATTLDGYNPYRITRQGLDWEIPEPQNPWANIGYWSDHQIIYLQKLMEISARVHPGKLQEFFTHPMFTYANVPYRIKPYADLLADPYNTIRFDWELERKIETQVKKTGSDGKLLHTPEGQLVQAALGEKLLTLLLAKLVNFVPEGGIWMNTQRPEWNDANNALVGKGLSVVTLGYLRRYVQFFLQLLQASGLQSIPLNPAVAGLYRQIGAVLAAFQPDLAASFSDTRRRAMLNALGQAGSDYREQIYSAVPPDSAADIPLADLCAFLELSLRYVEHSLRANRRSDHLYHAYNILHLEDAAARITRLSEMLEGQVSILASGLLAGDEALALLESMRNSPLYRPDQHTYILYPDRQLPGFLQKNSIPPARVAGLPLISALLEAGDRSLMTRDEDGSLHFNGRIRNFKDVARILDALRQQPRYAALVDQDAAGIAALFEDTFHHNEFTGRSGTFFAYEGLGSIYWHMVSKLLLAVQESILNNPNAAPDAALIEKYHDIRRGQCFYKTPTVYGAFPADPYSHTPAGQGAKQPGMTGMVKEEILARQAELGLSILNGCLTFDFRLLKREEFFTAAAAFSYWDVNGQQQSIQLAPGTLASTFCQVPVILQQGGPAGIEVHFSNGQQQVNKDLTLDAASSAHIFQRDGVIHHLLVHVPQS